MRAPKNNRERLYGHLPILADKDCKVALQKRDKAARTRLLHSTIDIAKWENERCPPCTNCAVYLANWEGLEEGPRPLCVEGPGSSTCKRCLSDGTLCESADLHFGSVEVRVLEETAKNTSADDHLVSVSLCFHKYGLHWGLLIQVARALRRSNQSKEGLQEQGAVSASLKQGEARDGAKDRMGQECRN